MKPRPILLIVVAVAVALAVLVFYVFVHWHQTLEIKLGTEVFKSTYQYLFQFFVIVVLGGFVTFIYTLLAKDREQRANQEAKDRELLASEEAKKRDKEA